MIGQVRGMASAIEPGAPVNPLGEGPPLLSILWEDEDLLVVNKPAGLVCHPTKAGANSSLIGRVRLRLGAGEQPQMVNRLDRETSGLVVVARRAAAAGELRRIWEARQVRKEYQAIVWGQPAPEHGNIEAPLGKDDHSQVAIKDCVRADGAAARTEYWRLATVARHNGRFSLLRVVPWTGRKHQIRIHLAFLGHPLVGDKLYGGNEGAYLAFVKGRLTAEQQVRLLLPFQALHAGRLSFAWRGRSLVFQADPEPWFTEFLGGAGARW
jgi:23S rRNA pseudouridine1911/1915/1917 synthase